jgi:alpha-glucosidase
MPWHAKTIAGAVEAYEGSLPSYGWPNWVLGNHDNHRIATRVGGEQARVAAMLLLTLRGTPTMYYGDEIGMTDVVIPAGRVQDPFEKNVPGIGLGRDPERTPMQWDASANGGFAPAGVEPWLPAGGFETVGVESQRGEATSMLTLYRKLIELRRSEAALSIGKYRHVAVEGDVYAYEREETGRRFVVALNFGAGSQRVNSGVRGKVVVGTHLDRVGEAVEGTIELRGNEGVVIGVA